jgi:cyclase
MFAPRIIPVLLIDNGKLVKTVQFGNYKYIGDPINAIKIFNESEVDELILLDISATKNNKLFDLGLLENISKINKIPISIGGGIKNINDIYKILRIGAEKIILCSRMNHDFLSEAISTFGSSTVSVCVNVKKNIFGNYKLYSYTEKKIKQINLKDYLIKLDKLGVGEIILQNVDRDGTLKGFDRDLYMDINNNIECPLTALGGASSFEDIKDFWLNQSISGFAAGSIFVFYGPLKGVLINYPKFDKDEFRKKFL